jgi:hypothetical protein
MSSREQSQVFVIFLGGVVLRESGAGADSFLQKEV